MAIKTFNSEVNRRYLHAKDQIDECADKIHAYSKMLELASDMDPLDNPLNPQAIGMLGKLISTDIGKIISHLDEFAHPVNTDSN